MVTLFQVSSTFVVPFWLLMVLAPRWRVTRAVIGSAAPIIALAGLYALLVLPRIGALWSDLSGGDLPKIAALLGSPEGATIAWVHFLAFDLFVGRWIYLDSRERGLAPWAVGPVLVLTLMFGPLGYLAYLGLRLLTRARPPEAGPVGQSTVTPGAGFVQRIWRLSPSLTVLTFASLALLVPVLAGVLLDPRVITGAPAWLKPAKFLFSVAIYALTLAWVLSHVQGRPRWVAWIANITTVSLAVELAIILVQAGRGTTSHYNTATPLDSALWSLMGAFITVVWLMGAAAMLLLLRQTATDRVLATSLKLGLLLALTGMAEGMLMANSGAHSVAVRDGGPGLPLMGWSTTGGDLRVAHFLGLHALQALPLLGWLLSRMPGLTERQRIRLVQVGAAAFAGVLFVTTWQALRGQPLVRPDALTWGSWGALALAVAAVTGWVLLRERKPAALSGTRAMVAP